MNTSVPVPSDCIRIYQCQEQAYEELMHKPKNIIFLDIDGVLNTFHCAEITPQNNIGILDSRVKVLSEIISQNDASIVLTSSWKDEWCRSCSESGFADSQVLYMMQKLDKANVYIADKTIDQKGVRGYGIIDWLNNHPHKNWIVFDDMIYWDFKECGIFPHLIRTSHGVAGGLKPKHIQMAKKLFEKDER